jgi:hypothetical protein
MDDETQVKPTDLAWGEVPDNDEDIDITESFHHPTLSAALVALLLVLAAVATWFATTLYRGDDNHEISSAPTVSTQAPATATVPPPADMAMVPDPSEVSDLLAQVPNAGVVQPDLRYFALLRNKGVISGDHTLGLQSAHMICQAHQQGWSRPQLASQVLQSNPAVTPGMAFDIVTTAIETFCP